ncbi:MAG TPA: ribonuclease Z [Candidatus Cloacimonetes bacterium]|nr:ribonuclease Z [Candidatus Cloacimonadota bacterium]
MKLYALGTGSGMASKDLNCSCYLLERENKSFILDCGEGCTQTLLRMDYDIREIEAIIICHYHPDHLCGIFMLMQTMYLKGRKKPLKLYLPEREDEFLGFMQYMYLFEERFAYELEICSILDLPKDYPYFSLMKNDHLIGYTAVIEEGGLPNQQRAYSVRIAGEKGDMAYSSDIGDIKSIEKLIDGVHTFICDGLHPPYEELERLLELSIKRVIFTHETPKEAIMKLKAQDAGRFEEIVQGESYTI